MLPLSRSCRYRLVEGDALVVLAAAHRDRGRTGEARRCAREAVAALEGTGHRDGERQARSQLAVLEPG